MPEGATLEVTASLSTLIKSGPTSVSANLLVGAPGLPVEQARAHTVKLTLKADVRRFLKTAPVILDLGTVPAGEARSATSLIRSTTGQPFRLEELPSRVPRPDGLSLWLEPLHPAPDGRSTHWRATARVEGNAKIGPGGYLLRAATDVPISGSTASRPSYHEAAVTVSYQVQGAYSLDEDFLSFGLLRPGQVIKRSVGLSAHAGALEPKRLIARLELETPGADSADRDLVERALSAAVRSRSEDSAEIELKLDALPATFSGAFRGQLIVETQDPALPSLSVRFAGVCSRSAR